VQATAGIGSATVSWSPSSAGYGNQPLQTYVVTAYDAATQTYAGITTVPSSQTTATFQALNVGEAYDFEVYAQNVVDQNNVNVQYDSPSSAPSNTIVPTNVAEADESTASGTDPAPSGTLNDGSPLTATSVGTGSVTLGSYASSPQAGLASGTTYFDVAASGSLSSVTINACDANLSLPLQWWSAASESWQDVSPPATLAGGCLTWTATTTSTPSVSELYGTAFASFVASAPGAPVISTVKPGDKTVTVSWSPPSNDGGSTITAYKVSATPGSQSCSTVTKTSCAVTGLTNGTSYAFSVTATNRIGTSSPSTPLSAIPALVPGSPSQVTAKPGDDAATITWKDATVTGGSPITGYLVTALHTTSSCTSTGTSCVLTGLVNGTTYQVVVVAQNAVGNSPETAAVAVRPRWVPAAPAIAAVVPSNHRVSVSWSVPQDNGKPITSYEVTASPSAKTCVTTATSCVVKGLTDGTAYRFSVTATNAVGLGPASALSPPVTPGLHGVPTLTLTHAGTLQAGDEVTFTATIESGVTGSIGFSDHDGQLCAPSTIEANKVTCEVTFEDRGTFKVIATYGGSAAWASATAERSVVIEQGQSQS
jgi:hypothetical protein